MKEALKKLLCQIEVTQEDSKAVQEAVFASGGYWFSLDKEVIHLDEPYLSIGYRATGVIGFSSRRIYEIPLKTADEVIKLLTADEQSKDEETMKIKIKSREEIEKTLNKNSYHEAGGRFGWTMFEFCGKVVDAEPYTGIHPDRFSLVSHDGSGYDWHWHSDWYDVVEPDTTEDEPQKTFLPTLIDQAEATLKLIQEDKQEQVDRHKHEKLYHQTRMKELRDQEHEAKIAIKHLEQANTELSK